MTSTKILKICIIVATVGYIAGFAAQGAVIANHNMWNAAREATYPNDPPPVPAALELAQQELRFLRSEIEQEKTTLVKHQRASYEALQEAEALNARVSALKLCLSRRK